ncbi:MAG: hypothetical protein V4508_04070 [Pseudomonadota bacterium]
MAVENQMFSDMDHVPMAAPPLRCKTSCWCKRGAGDDAVDVAVGERHLVDNELLPEREFTAQSSSVEAACSVGMDGMADLHGVLQKMGPRMTADKRFRPQYAVLMLTLPHISMAVKWAW